MTTTFRRAGDNDGYWTKPVADVDRCVFPGCGIQAGMHVIRGTGHLMMCREHADTLAICDELVRPLESPMRTAAPALLRLAEYIRQHKGFLDEAMLDTWAGELVAQATGQSVQA